MPRAYANPEFLLTGWSNGDGTVSVAASDSLSVAEFQMRTVALNIDDYRIPLKSAGLDLRVGMQQLHIAVGATYQDALRNLFEHWSPDKSPFALNAPQKALDA